MFSFYNADRLYATLAWANGSPAPVTKSMPRGKILRSLIVRLAGAAAIATAANNSLANTKKGDEWACIARIEVKLGDHVVCSMTGEQLWWTNYFLNANAPMVTAAFGDATSTSVAFDSVLTIPLWNRKLDQPMETALDTSDANASDFSVTVNFSDSTAINANATSWGSGGTAPTVYVYAYEDDTQGFYNPNGPNQLPFGFGAPFWKPMLTSTQKSLAASGSGQEIDLPTGRRIAGLLINTTNATPVDTAGLCTNFQWQRNGKTIFNVPEQVMRQRYLMNAGMNTGFNRALSSGKGAIGLIRQSTGSDQSAWYFFDCLKEGRLAQMVDNVNTTDSKLIVDTSAATTFNIVTLGYLPRTG